jgi:hypothetical protein
MQKRKADMEGSSSYVEEVLRGKGRTRKVVTASQPPALATDHQGGGAEMEGWSKSAMVQVTPKVGIIRDNLSKAFQMRKLTWAKVLLEIFPVAQAGCSTSSLTQFVRGGKAWKLVGDDKQRAWLEAIDTWASTVLGIDGPDGMLLDAAT